MRLCRCQAAAETTLTEVREPKMSGPTSELEEEWLRVAAWTSIRWFDTCIGKGKGIAMFETGEEQIKLDEQRTITNPYRTAAAPLPLDGSR